ncbi:nitroreductase family protein [Winogradskyella litoriviva]|uniref:Nitroreductase family protein n=1 Tax=Winogradskyella litoriviva TaxID=1220182 RepID=A0ABX2E3K7_9FLAO|nr:nitroreductase family protein [Winogradskyella litoriviva]NRD22832.1 nitroreductase family protein [Winogradskyella litoriviva]
MISVLIGKKIHNRRNTNIESNQAFIRRSIHRIEKGLIIPHSRRDFALDYINKTCQILFVTYNELDEKSKKWALDVLDAYFDIANMEIKVVSNSKRLYDDFKKQFVKEKRNKNLSVPFKYDNLKSANIEYTDLLSFVKKRHSIRYFKDLIVDKHIIENAIKVGLQSPSACNRQPFEVIVVQDKEKIGRTLNLPMGITTYKHEIKNIAIVLGDLSYYEDERDRHIIYIDGGLFSMSFVYGLEAQGIASCIINWPDIEQKEKDFYKEFKIPQHKRCICFIAFGYAKNEGLVPFSEKKDTLDILSYNEYTD